MADITNSRCAMYMTEAVKAGLPAMVEWIMTFPKDLCFTLDDGHAGCATFRVAIQAWTQAAAADVRAMAPKGLVWKKSYAEDSDWWAYDAFSPTLDCDIHIYAIREAPPTCRIERRMVEVEEEIPVAFEKRMVQKEIVEVHCEEGAVE